MPDMSALSKHTYSLICRSNNINLRLPGAARDETLGFMHTFASSLGCNCSFRCYSSTYLTSEMLSEMH